MNTTVRYVTAAFCCAVTLAVAAPPPSFSLAWSEYPSWSTFGVAHEFKLIDGGEGKLGPVETRWNVDIVLKQADYDPCLVMYGSKRCDAVCITNMDVLSPALGRPSVAIMPTSTSFGADALIVTSGVTDIKQLRGKKVYGLAKTVSEYCFVRNLQILNEKESDYAFTNMDPAAAALAMQQSRKDYDAIVVWNPFVLDTLNKRKDCRVLFDSTAIPNEIVDMVVVAQDALDKPGGPAFASAVADTFYKVCERLASEATRDETLLALGEKFSNLDLQSMRKVVQQTKFYSTPAEAIALYEGAEFKKVMDTVIDFCATHEVTPSKPTVAFGPQKSAAALRFDTTYLQGLK
jgi:NitT/TauT family transport system substrate-binding protein